jgi:hypothetical protein
MRRTPAISRTCPGDRCGRLDRLERVVRERDDAARRAPFGECRGLRVVVRRMQGPASRAHAILRDTLRVAVDPFADAEIRYRSLVQERRTGILQTRAFRIAVRDLAVLDSEGRRWMLGPEDGIWYRRERERWLQADPPRRLVCPSCGHHNLGRHSFCVECGQRLNR